jgi:RNA polymerase sigma-70 factor (ECF subfamily)
MTDHPLLTAARRGNLDAFNELLALYQNRAYTLAYRLIGETDPAADATQEAFISAYHHLNQFQGGSIEQFSAWLMRIVTNTCYNELRRRKRHPQLSLDTPESEARFASPAESPEQAAQRSELNSAIQACLNDLPADQRQVIVLCDVQGYDYQQIAEHAQLSLGTVKSRISRARAKLRDCLLALRELLPDDYRL